MDHGHREKVRRRGCTDRTRKTDSDTSPQLEVILSEDLLNHLRLVAHEQHIPLPWLVAGLVCDTLESGTEPSMDRQAVLTGN
jgi:hypothetical protein